MHESFSGAMIRVAVAGLAVSVAVSLAIPRASAQMPGASGKAPVSALRTPWGNRICRESGPTRPIRRCSARPNMPIRNFSPTLSAQNWTDSVRRCGDASGGRSAGQWRMSPAPTMTCLRQRSAPARGHRGSSIRLMAGCRRRLRKRRRLPPLSANFDLRCCKRPKPARTRNCRAAGASTIQPLRRVSAIRLPL